MSRPEAVRRLVELGLEATDPDRRARGVTAGGIWQKGPSARHPGRGLLSAGPSLVAGGKMGRERPAVRPWHSKDRLGQVIFLYPSIWVSPQMEMAWPEIVRQRGLHIKRIWSASWSGFT